MTELSNTINELNEAFCIFKKRNDEKIDSISESVRKLEIKAGRPDVDLSKGINGFTGFDSLRDIMMMKSMDALTDGNGGYLAGWGVSLEINERVEKQSPIRRLANVITTQWGNNRYPLNLRGTTAGWVGENDERTETSTPTLFEPDLTGGTLYSAPMVSEELVEDALVDMDLFIQNNVVDTFAEKESYAFINGSGVKQPTGFLHGTPVSTGDDSRANGVIQYIASGKASALPDDMLSALNKMVYSLKAGYRQADGCAWLMSTDTISAISNIKDTTGRPIYLPSVSFGYVPSDVVVNNGNAIGYLLGFPVCECEHMPAVGAGAFPIAFGNWKRGYTIVDRTEISVLRDPYTTKGKISWYFRKRLYAGVSNSEAIKLLKVSTN